MPNYDFKKDLPVAVKTEEEVAHLLEEKYGAVILEYRHDNQYDLLIRLNDKEIKIEIKEDFTCEKTGNVGLEFKCRGKLSGISVSKADYYIYKIHSPNGIIFVSYSTMRLKEMICARRFSRIVSGGDKGSNSLNYLFKLPVFIQYGKVLPLTK